MYKKNIVNVVMPVYNEEKTISRIVRRVLRSRYVDRLIIVDDNSSDNTLSEIRGVAKQDKRVSLVLNNANKGKGYAVRRGIEHVGRGLVLIQDADEEYYPEDYGRLLAAFSDKNPVFGYRRGNSGHLYVLGNFANEVHVGLFNFLFGQSLKDINTCYKLFSVEMLGGRKLKENSWQIEIEIAVALLRNGYVIRQVPIRYKGRTFEEGKKIGAWAAVGNVLYMLKSRFYWD